MIACVQIGKSIAQGELIAQWDQPHRWAPRFALETISFATIDIGNRKLTGRLIKREVTACPNASS